MITYFITKSSLSRRFNLENNRESVSLLFTIPLIFAVALLTFAHWANDVANAIGPIAAIYDTVISWTISEKVNLPVWILILWGWWIALWLALFWPRIIKTVGSEITQLDVIRAFSVALAASITVIIASQLWLPVSSTHIAIGWIMWVWFLREYLDRKTRNWEKYVKRNIINKIIAAWLITVPVTALLSATVFMILKDIML
jgi:PiT family inorganic phosphate transporter